MVLNRQGQCYTTVAAAAAAAAAAATSISTTKTITTSSSMDSASSNAERTEDFTHYGINAGRTEDFTHYGINIIMNHSDSSVRRGAVVKTIALFSAFPWIESLKWTLFAALEESFVTPTDMPLLFAALNSVQVQHLPHPTVLDRQVMLRSSVDVQVYGRLLAMQVQKRKLRESSATATTTAAVAAAPSGEKEQTQEQKRSEAEAEAEEGQQSLPNVLHDYHHVVPFKIGDKPYKLSIPLYLSSDQIGDLNFSRLLSVFRHDTMRIYSAILAGQRVLFVGHGHAAKDVAQMVLSAVAMLCPALPGLVRRAFPYTTLSDLSFLETKGFIAGCTNPMFSQKKTWCDLLCVLDLPRHTGTVIEYTALKTLVVEPRSSATSSASHASSAAQSRDSSSVQGSSKGKALPPNSFPFVAGEDTNSPSQATAAAGTEAGFGIERPGDVREGSNDDDGDDSHVVSNAAYELHPGTHAQADKEWISAVLSEIEVEDATEELVRRRFQDFAALLLLQAEDTAALQFSPRLSDAARKVMQANMYRCELLRNASEYRDRGVRIAQHWGHNGAACRNHMRRLATNASLHYSEAEGMYRDLERALRTDEALRALIGYFPPEQGVQLVAVGMLNSSPEVRAHALSIMRRLQQHSSTAVTFSFLSKLLRNQFARLSEKEQNGLLVQEQGVWGQVSQLALADSMRRIKTSSMDSSMAFDMM